MTDKEILTEKQAKSIGMTFPPSLATPSAGNKLTAGADPQANNVYQSVSQKGKLILPTALWILLVLAGITFLSLLATLNKSMSTLDALVEIEQHNRIDEELKKFSREMQKNSANIELLPVSEALKLEDKSNDDEDLTLVDSSPLKSFLSFPDWASLEPRRSKLMKDDGEFSSFINDVFSSMQRGKQPNKLSPISESIIIASGNLDPRRAQNQFQSNNPIGALLEGLLGDGLATSKTDSVQQQPLIQANIDRVNINVNTHEDSQKSNKRPLKGQQEEQQHDREMINSIDKSIDNLMAQLVEPQLQKTQANDMPTSLLDHSMFKPTVNHNHNHPLNQLEQLGPNPSPFSPISNLIFPFEMPPPFNSLEPKEFHHSNRHNQNQKNIQMNDILLSPIPMFGKPKLPVNEPPASILMIESGPAPYDQFIPFEQLMPISALPSGKSHRKDGQKQQQIGEKQADQQLSFMDENLLGSLAQSFLQGQEISPIKQTHGTSELSKLTNGNSNDDDIETIVFVNGQPIINEKKQSLATSEADLVSMKKKNDKSKDKNEIKDLFQMFFGEPPKNSLAVAPTSEIPSITMVKSLDDGASSSNKKEESDILKLDKEKVNISESAPGDNTKEAQQEVDNFFGKFLSLPQFAGDEQVMKVEPMAEKEQKIGKNEHKPTRDFTTTTASMINSNSNEKSNTSASVEPEMSNNSSEEAKTSLPAFSSSIFDLDFEDTAVSKDSSLDHGRVELTASQQNSSSPTPPLSVAPTMESTSHLIGSSSTEKPEIELGITTSASVENPTNSTAIVGTNASSEINEIKPSLEVAEKQNTTIFKSFLRRADEFIGKNIANIKKLLN